MNSNLKKYCKYLIDNMNTYYTILKEDIREIDFNDMHDGLLELYEFNTKSKGNGKISKRDTDNYRVTFLEYSCDIINITLKYVKDVEELMSIEVFTRENQIKNLLDEA